MIAAWIGPFSIGHYYGYTDNKFTVWRMVQDDSDETFDPTWKNMDKGQVFDRYVQSVTGNTSGGFAAYLSLMAYEGWSGPERTGGLSRYVERRGIWVWVAWGVHLVFLLAATGAAMGATIPDKKQEQGGRKSESRPTPEKKQKVSPPALGPQKKQKSQRNPDWAGGSIHTFVQPEKEEGSNGWWLIKVSFWERETTFRAYYPDKTPTGRSFFRDIHRALYRLRSQGPLTALAVLGSVEGGLSAKEALEKLEDDNRKIRYVLNKHYFYFENADSKFFAVFFAGDDDEIEK